MSRKDTILLASRVLAVLITVWVLSEVSYLPGYVYSFLYYFKYQPSPKANLEYVDFLRHSHLIGLAFSVTRIVGLSLMAMWVYKGGPEIESLLLPNFEENVN
jgi:hypothetical protein